MAKLPKITFGTICTGVGGFDLGFEEAGMECRWMIEIDKQCQTILRKHFPNAKLYADATKKEALEIVDVIAGGTPCQGFSIAGLRGGIKDGRSNLCLRFVQICDELNPGVVSWENVPGCLSMPDNAFGCFIGALAGLDSPLVHPDTENFKKWWRDGECPETGDYRFPVWPRAGMVAGPKRTVAWRVLNSEYFGLAQRRERLFVIASPHTRAGSLGAETFQDAGRFFGVAGKILFEPEMLRRHSAPSRYETKDVAGTIGASPPGSGPRTDPERMTLVPEVAKPLGAHALSKGRGTDLDNTTYVPEIFKALKASKGGINREDGHTLIPTHEISPALQERGDKGADSDCIQAHVIVPPFVFDETQITSKGNYSNPKPGDPSHPLASSARPPTAVIAFDRTTSEVTGEVSSTLRACGAKAKGVNNGKADTQCVAFQPGNVTDGRGSPPSEISPALKAENDGDTRQCVAFRAAGQDGFTPSDVSPPLASTDGGGAGVPTAFFVHSNNSKAMEKAGPGKAGGEAPVARALDTNGGYSHGQGGNVIARPRYGVRRLVPVECEKLQGFPEDWTLIGLDSNGKQVIQKDSPRYRQCGNAVSKNVALWIGKRIKKYGFEQ